MIKKPITLKQAIGEVEEWRVHAVENCIKSSDAACYARVLGLLARVRENGYDIEVVNGDPPTRKE